MKKKRFLGRNIWKVKEWAQLNKKNWLVMPIGTKFISQIIQLSFNSSWLEKEVGERKLEVRVSRREKVAKDDKQEKVQSDHLFFWSNMKFSEASTCTILSSFIIFNIIFYHNHLYHFFFPFKHFYSICSPNRFPSESYNQISSLFFSNNISHLLYSHLISIMKPQIIGRYKSLTIG